MTMLRQLLARAALLVVLPLCAGTVDAARIYRLVDYPDLQNGHTLSGTITTTDDAPDDGLLDLAEILDWEWEVSDGLEITTGQMHPVELDSQSFTETVGIEIDSQGIYFPHELGNRLKLQILTNLDSRGSNDWRLGWFNGNASPPSVYVFGGIVEGDIGIQSWGSDLPNDQDRWLIATIVPEPSAVPLAAMLLATIVLKRHMRTIACAFAGCHCWLAQQWKPGTRCALLDKTSSGTPRRSLVGCLFAAACLFTSSVAPAAVIERDWLEHGDGLLTFDTVNQREWLDLTQSLMIDVGQFDSEGNFTFDYRLDVLDELEPGGRFEGFVAATAADVTALAESAGIDTSTTLDFASNAAATAQLINLIGPTLGQPVSDTTVQSNAIGLVSDINIGGGQVQGHVIYINDATLPEAGLLLLNASDTARVLRQVCICIVR